MSGLVGLYESCTKPDNSVLEYRSPALPEVPYAYNQLPALATFDAFGGVPIDNDKATLGRVLFYDTQLSLNNRTSCGTCHMQNNAFADHFAFTPGFNGGQTGRNTPSIVNAGTQNKLFWDMRADSLRQMVLMPIGNHIEMGLSNQTYLVAKVDELPYYDELLIKAYGDNEVSVPRISECLASFVRSIVSCSSKFDEGTINNFSNFTEEELIGKELYFVTLPCATCHGNFYEEPLDRFNIGLDMEYSDGGIPGTLDDGRQRNGWFKAPSLRNIEITTPYMHDGRFKTLEEVINFYNDGVKPHEQLSDMLRRTVDGGFFIIAPEYQALDENHINSVQPLRMHMSASQKHALIAFLKTVTDNTYLTDPKFSNPFRAN